MGKRGGPSGSPPTVKGYTFTRSYYRGLYDGNKYDRRLAIRLDRLELDGVAKTARPEWDQWPIKISIMNGGGSRNGGVIGGQTTWYDLVKSETQWSVRHTMIVD